MKRYLDLCARALTPPFGLLHALVLGLAARLLALSVLEAPVFPDAFAYATAGRDLLERGQMVAPTYMPLYPLWVALWGDGIGVRVADTGLSLAVIAILHRLCVVIFNDSRAAMIAAFAAALYPHFIFYPLTGLTETAYVFILCGAYLLLYRQQWVAGSIAMILSILVRPALDVVAPLVVVLFACLVHRQGWRGGALRVAQYSAIYALLMSPWWVHNYAKYGQFVRLNLGDGQVIYAGNNPLNRSGGGITGIDVDLTVTATYKDDPYTANEIMKREAYKFIREDPWSFLKLCGIRLLRFWQPWPYADEYRRPEIIAASVLSYVPVLILAAVFLWREGALYMHRLAPIFAFMLFLTAVHITTIASIRYRFPLEPFLVVLAARASAQISRQLKNLERVATRLFK